MLAASVHSGLSEEAEPRCETLLVDIIDLLTVMGAVGGEWWWWVVVVGEARYSLMATQRHLSLKELFFFLITRKVNPQSMKL